MCCLEEQVFLRSICFRGLVVKVSGPLNLDSFMFEGFLLI